MEKRGTIEVFVFHYKPGNKFPDYPCYVPIWAGKNETESDCELIGDNSGDHISHKNNYFSELTGIYWAWKNSTNSIIGTSHYRRFFTNHPIPFSYKLQQIGFFLIRLKRKRHGLIYTSNIDYWKDKIINCAEIEDIMANHDAILPQPRKLRYTVETHFNRYHRSEDLKLLHTIIRELQPEFSSDFDLMLKQKQLYANNMFILRREEFDLLCNWLFSILFEFEKRVKLENYIGYQERLFGFLSERLITLWFTHRKLNVKQLPLIYFKKFKYQHD